MKNFVLGVLLTVVLGLVTLTGYVVFCPHFKKNFYLREHPGSQILEVQPLIVPTQETEQCPAPQVKPNSNKKEKVANYVPNTKRVFENC